MSDEDSTTTINDIADSGTFNINYTDCNFIDNNNNLNEQDLLKYGNNNLKIMNRRKQIKPIRYVLSCFLFFTFDLYQD